MKKKNNDNNNVKDFISAEALKKKSKLNPVSNNNCYKF